MTNDYSLLLSFLYVIREHDSKGEYAERNEYILHALSAAKDLGFKAGLWLDAKEPNWPVVYIELPTGQVSWHIPFDENRWDGHSTEEKYRRIEKFFSDYKDEWA